METCDQILNILDDLHTNIVRTSENFKKCPKSRQTKGYLEAKLICVDEYWNSFKNAHNSLLKSVSKEQRKRLDYFNKEVFYTCEEVYLQVKASMKDSLEAVQPQFTQTKITENKGSQLGATQVKLPKIEIPTFSGNYEDWPTFQDLFNTLIHKNETISNVQKLQYLKSSVTSEAENLLKHVQVTEANYEQAWEVLKQRYSNKRLIVSSILKRMFNQRKLQSASVSQIKSLLDTTNECLNSLKNLNIITEHWDPLVIYLIANKLDPESHKEWEEFVSKEVCEDLPTLSTFKKFLELKFRTLELLLPSSSKDKTTVRSYHVTTNSKGCILCNENHALCHCKTFGKMELKKRREYANKNQICYNCLIPGHPVKACRSTSTCRICHKRHHTLLHHTSTTSTQGNSQEQYTQPGVLHTNVEEAPVQINTAMTSQAYSNQVRTVLLGTAVVTVRSEDGYTTVLRALIDPGSQGCLISERAAQLLKAKRYATKGNIIGVGSVMSRINESIQIEISSRFKNQFSLKVIAHVISKQLTSKIPTKSIQFSNWPHIQGLELADPSFNTSRSIDLLLGVDVYSQILLSEVRKGPAGTPCAQKSTLGWIIFGIVNDSPQVDQEESIIVMHQLTNLDDMLKSLWEIDTSSKRRLTKSEEKCEELFKNTYSRNSNGRYIVELPFKIDNPKSSEGNSRDIAMKRLKQLEMRLEKSPDLKQKYNEVLEEYLAMGHMEKISKHDIFKNSVYLPHHAVVRTDKESTKVRIVFDASCKNSDGISLNDELLVGPVLQEDLRSIILRWRTYKICFASDIEKMYRMINLKKEHTDYQRILWRRGSSEGNGIEDFRLLTVTFGTASAPYLAVRTLLQIADDECKNCPKAAKVIREDFYVDDLMSGGDTVQEAVEISRQLIDILQRCGFKLKKWTSNSAEFLGTIEPQDRSTHACLNLKIDGTVKALGLTWNLGEDIFQYTLNLPPVSIRCTKRTILADIQRMFDPLGWLAPVIIRAKILVQRLWLEGLNWDDEISENLRKEWIDIRGDLCNINEIRIKRWINTTTANKKNTSLHGFSDASIKAISAVVYCRTMDQNGIVKTSILAARTKVAPVKTVSLPRLELCGAVLLSKLLNHVANAMRIPSSQVYAWTDSSVVLAWLFGEPNRWKPFVANRVVEILENINNSQWYHVKSHNNPADVASRGCNMDELQDHNLWWKGPPWLLQKTITFSRPNIITTHLEKKSEKQVYLNMMENKNDTLNKFLDFNNFDTLEELQNIIVYSRRFLNFKRREYKEFGITTEELDQALKLCIKKAQSEDFSDDIRNIMEHKCVKNNSHLKTLNPFFDKELVIRVGGRLRHANISEDSKYPIILDSKSPFTALIVADAHKKTLHGGLQLMLSYLRTKYWIIKAKGIVKSHIFKCLICAKIRAKTRSQIMGDLPSQRVNPSRPFLNSGVDFAGPFNILMSKGKGIRTSKSYIAIFICLSTKAIHLELVSDLTSEAFIAAFKRFVSRRGHCAHLWSDQGRTFIAANRELKEFLDEANIETLKIQTTSTLAKDGTQWHFIPPYSPTFGGLWEAGVKSMKGHLKRVLTTNLTYEEMSTLLCQIEACLNSRPLTPIDDYDVDNLNPLTPGHFLIGEALITVPSPNLTNVNVSLHTRWLYTQKLLNDFWHRWQQEYLTRLQQRPKWLKAKKEFSINEIVLIKQDNMPPGKWMMGRILNKHPGPDGITRVYSVKCGDSVTKRNVLKLCHLPINTE